MDLKHAIEQDESEEIARRLNSDYYSKEAAIVAREILKSRGYSQESEVQQLANVSSREHESYQCTRRRKTLVFFSMLLAPYIYGGLVVFLDTLIIEMSTVYKAVYTVVLFVATGYGMRIFYVFSNATLGRENPFIFLILFANSLFVVPMILIVSAMSLLD